MKKKIRVIIKGPASTTSEKKEFSIGGIEIPPNIEELRSALARKKQNERITREALLHYIDFLQEKIGCNEEKIEELENVIDYTEQDIEAAHELLDYLKGAGKDAKTL